MDFKQVISIHSVRQMSRSSSIVEAVLDETHTGTKQGLIESLGSKGPGIVYKRRGTQEVTSSRVTPLVPIR